VYLTAVVLSQGRSEHEMAFSAFAKHAVSRSGAVVCGVIGFYHHMGVWSALLGAIGWLIVFDHVGYLLRRRYSDRARAWLSQRHPIGRAGGQLVNALHSWVGDPGGASAAYRTFVVNNTATAVVWGTAYAAVGYLMTARWYRVQTDSTGQAAALAGAGVILGIALTVYQHRLRPDRNTQGASPTGSRAE
jgi:membrane protein DedA with SNARE-associated domain